MAKWSNMPLRTSSQGSLFFKSLMSSGPDISSTQDIATISSDHHRRSVLIPSPLSSPSPSPSPVTVSVSSLTHSSSSSSSSPSPSPTLYRTRSDGASLLAIDADVRKQKPAPSSIFGARLGDRRERQGGRSRRRPCSDTVQKLSVSDPMKSISLISENTTVEAFDKSDDIDVSGLEKLSSLSVDRSEVLTIARYKGLSEEKHGLSTPLAMDPPDLVQAEVKSEEETETSYCPLPFVVSDEACFLENKERNGELMQSFTSEDGEVFNSLRISSSGVPLACNGKGCRPLTRSESRTLGFLGTNHGSGYGDGDGSGFDSGYGDGDGENGEAYFQKLLQSDPENPLILRNYAQFLCEKRGDVKRSEEYYERAILAEPNDGEVLSEYAQLQWNVHGDKDRAEAYYNRAIEAAPEDCYVMASYASFLWDAEDDEEENMKSSLPSLPAHSTASSPLLLASV